MMAAFGLGEDDHGLEAATRGYYRWRREQSDLDQDTGDFKPREGREEFRRHMRRAEQRMKLADEPGAQKEVSTALGLPTSRGRTSRSPSGAASSSTTSSPSSSTA
jgi:hypothetical protein